MNTQFPPDPKTRRSRRRMHVMFASISSVPVRLLCLALLLSLGACTSNPKETKTLGASNPKESRTLGANGVASVATAQDPGTISTGGRVIGPPPTVPGAILSARTGTTSGRKTTVIDLYATASRNFAANPLHFVYDGFPGSTNRVTLDINAAPRLHKIEIYYDDGFKAVVNGDTGNVLTLKGLGDDASWSNSDAPQLTFSRHANQTLIVHVTRRGSSVMFVLENALL